MPIYEYKCDACGHRFEKLQSFGEEPVKTCPRCGGEVRKLISRSSFILRGSGWYATDYARKNGGNGSSSSTSDTGSSNKSSCSSCSATSCSSCSSS
ncbi:MAG TPA: zinc ribbon domain-containing protein [Thermosulfidibacter takaii]|uniref:Zinc ribbon domain-containing protein n=1 Tax=Thermosulfidibacter takaii TaxID=412593 RepID=A0A7C0U5F2_9BACT|nr:zinc ribbon domain-containing protein [Thermosulfidibacter takaii]